MIILNNIFRFLFLTIVFISCDKGLPEKSLLSANKKSYDLLITKMVDDGVQLYEEGEYLESQAIFNKADSLIYPEIDTIIRIRLLFNKTELLKHLGEYETCIVNYYEASKLAKLTGDSVRLGLAYYNISSTHFLMNNIEKADEYNLLAQEIYRNTEEKYRLMNCYILYSSISKRKQNLPQAKRYLDKALQFYKKKGEERNLAICMNNFANILIEEKKYMPAIDYYEKSSAISKKLNDKYGLALRLGNIGEAYLGANHFEKADAYIDSSLKIAKEIDAKQTILSNLERQIYLYRKQNKSAKALKVFDQLIDLKTELLKVESSQIIQSVEEKFEFELESINAKNKISLLEKDKLVAKKEQERTSLKLYFFIFLSVLIVAVTFIIYKKQKKIHIIDLQLHLKEKEILESNNRMVTVNLANKESEKLRLQNELEFKRKELITFSLSLSEREFFLKSIKNAFSKIAPNENPKPEVLRELKKLLFNIPSNEEMEIYNRIEELNSSFHYNLESNYPNLTEEDIRLASLLVLGLSSKEISNLLNIESKSVDMKRYRLKKKLNLDGEKDLTTFLLGIK